MDSTPNMNELSDEYTSKQKSHEFLKTVEPRVVDSKELDVVLKEMFRWVVEKAYVPTAQENRISMTYNFIPFGSGITSAYLSSLAFKRIGIPKGILTTFPVTLIGLSTVFTTARYSRKAVNYRLMELGTPMGEKMIEIIRQYRMNPQNYEELSKTDMLTYRKYVQDAAKKRQEMANAIPLFGTNPPQNESPPYTYHIPEQPTQLTEQTDFTSPYQSPNYNRAHPLPHDEINTLQLFNDEPTNETETTWSQSDFTWDDPQLYNNSPEIKTKNGSSQSINKDGYSASNVEKPKKYKTWEEIRQQQQSS